MIIKFKIYKKIMKTYKSISKKNSKNYIFSKNKLTN